MLGMFLLLMSLKLSHVDFNSLLEKHVEFLGFVLVPLVKKNLINFQLELESKCKSKGPNFIVLAMHSNEFALLPLVVFSKFYFWDIHKLSVLTRKLIFLRKYNNCPFSPVLWIWNRFILVRA
jgi:hypothetical protein